MSSPFAGAGDFKPVTGDKNAREALIEFAERNGWMLDLTATRFRNGWQKAETTEQDPNQFVRAAEFGDGHWVMALDYEVKGDEDSWSPHRRWDNTLRAMTIWHSSWVNEKGHRLRGHVLRNYIQLNTRVSELWDLTDDPTSAAFKPLVKRAKEIIRHPDLAVWLVAQRKWEAEEVDRQHRAEMAERQRLRAEPLAVANVSDFRDQARGLVTAGRALMTADGLTDLNEFVTKVEGFARLLRENLTSRGTDIEIAVALPGTTAECFYCDAPLAPKDRALDPHNQRTYGPCCADYALRFQKKAAI